MFGKVTVVRIAYRGTGVADLRPADAALNLPDAMHSHGLARLTAIESARGGFAGACERINAVTGSGIGHRQVQEFAVGAAGDIDAFCDALVPAPCTDTTPLILSVDGKGVVIRPEALREDTAKAAAAKGGNAMKTRLASGEKHGRKRMATLGAVYDAEPAPHTVDDIIADPDRQDDAAHNAAPERRQGPKARSKWLCGSVNDTAAQVVAAVFDQAEHRGPGHRRPWVVLVGGARHQIDLIKAEALQRGVDVHIIVDLIHVLEYLWRAAWCLHDGGDASAESWVAHHARVLLGGGVQQTAAAPGAAACTAGLRGTQRKSIDEAVNYLTGKAEHLRSTPPLNAAGRSPPESSREHADTWSKTAWTSPAPTEACPELKPYSNCVPSAPMATSTPTGPGTSSRSSSATTRRATATRSYPPPDRQHPQKICTLRSS
ncbi:hypothetical protein [Streptomyces ipomoeae]|uniref:hypothetical protein n=2 Tax=Streptomyces ipomoeae TaxID=103232 RepID=UPI001319EA3E|nr:hypothetical protein [Streptomyces ipomoeae]MDX2696511.1 hypothetical protein [Streptomyces ipomoeae]MDX2841160.1 hypothetical protein [Streptomyces ipomoeae]